MNILVFSWRDPKHPLAGGAEQVMHEHMKGWIEAGNKVTLFSSKIASLPRNEILEGIVLIRRGYQYLGVQIAGFFYYLKNKDRYDFLVDQFHGVPFFTPLYSKKPKLAVIQEPASEVWFKNSLPFPLNYTVGLLGYIFEPLFFVFYRNTHFMTGSKSAKINVARFGIFPKRITIVPHGIMVPGTKKSEYSKTKRKTVSYLGILSKDKGIEDALKCFYLLNKKNDYDFWVIGKPENDTYLGQLKRLTKSLSLARKVKFWGRVDDDRKFKLLAKSHLLINPSIHEGWGLVNVEANYMGTPVVAYKSAGLVDSVKNGYSGVIVKKNTPKELALEVVKILSDKENYVVLQKQAILWSRKFNWRKSKKKSLGLINTIFSG